MLEHILDMEQIVQSNLDSFSSAMATKADNTIQEYTHLFNKNKTELMTDITPESICKQTITTVMEIIENRSTATSNRSTQQNTTKKE